MTDQETMLLSQYLDGELPADEAHVLRQRLLAEPALRARFDHMRKLDQQMKDAAAHAAQSVPASVTALLQEAPIKQRDHGGYRGLAIAASLLAATAVLMVPDWRSTPDTGADMQLSAVLEDTPSSADQWDILADGRQVRPVLSFASTSGRWCREFLVVTDSATQRGVACRTAPGQWSTEILADSNPAAAPNGAYIAASGSDSDAIETYIAEQARGIALGRNEEFRLIDNNWQ